MFAPPAVAGDLVFVGSCSGIAYALDRVTGDPVWSYDTRKDGRRNEFHGMPVVTTELIVTPTDDRREGGVGHIYAFERESGTVRWKHAVPAGVMTDLVHLDDMLYYATLTEQLEALRIRSGEVAWQRSADVSNDEFYATSTPVVTPRRVVFGGVDGVVRAVDRGSGELAWSRPLGNRVSTSLVRSGTALHAGTADGKLHSIRLEDGAVQQSLELGGMPFGRPVTLDDRLIVLSAGGRISAVIPTLEKRRWETAIDSEWASFRPVVVKDLVLVGADDGQLHALRIADGSHAWSRDFDGPVTSLSATEDCLYVGTSSGIVFSCGWTEHRER